MHRRIRNPQKKNEKQKELQQQSKVKDFIKQPKPLGNSQGGRKSPKI